MSIFLFKRKYLLLEPCEGKLSRTVLRGESTRKGADLPDHYIKMKGKATPNVISELENIFERNRGRNKIHQMRKDVETYEDTVSKRAALVEQRIGCKEARGQDKVH